MEANGQNGGREERVYFDAILHPSRSLSPRGFFIVMVVLAALSFVSGMIFALNGAWPVFGFFGLDVALVYWAFRANYRAGHLTETIRLTDRALMIANITPEGQAKSWEFEPAWLRIDIDEGRLDQARLSLWSHGKGLEIAAFLSPEERRDLAGALKVALAQRRAALKDG